MSQGRVIGWKCKLCPPEGNVKGKGNIMKKKRVQMRNVQKKKSVQMRNVQKKKSVVKGNVEKHVL